MGSFTFPPPQVPANILFFIQIMPLHTHENQTTPWKLGTFAHTWRKPLSLLFRETDNFMTSKRHFVNSITSFDCQVIRG